MSNYLRSDVKISTSIVLDLHFTAFKVARTVIFVTARSSSTGVVGSRIEEEEDFDTTIGYTVVAKDSHFELNMCFVIDNLKRMD